MMGGMPKKDAKPEDPIHNILKHQKEEREAQGESTQVGKMAATCEGKQATFEAPSSSGQPQTPAPSGTPAASPESPSVVAPSEPAEATAADPPSAEADAARAKDEL